MKENNTYHEGMEGQNLPESLRVNPFSVPTGYFDGLESMLIAQASLEGKVPPEKQPFVVPEGYFAHLTELVTAQIALTNPKEEVQSWTTPKNYFDTLQDKIQSRITVESAFQEQENFIVPAGYFESLGDRIQTHIFEEDLRSKIPSDGFAIPPKYFEALRSSISASLGANASESVSAERPVRQLRAQRWIQYAAAACVATVLGTASYNAVIDHNQVDVTASHLAAIEEEEIINYLTSSKGNDDVLYIMEYIYQPAESEGVCSKIKEDDIEDYLNYTL
ncbi:hypothetical protein [Sphingobacterium griseoflavum]|uniref:Uncharacterized protein n=1 Tax=Sphingobacterium griseoflavum TaxID=1474952 RepID=A0ABQ3I113_9SPHI|nr:hypothetical protein [Sphingobacterium griseoflavum]GHE44013.1 hypothetical protein GCM10017764_29170 [Sphingobacterium griseoflavum]